MKILVMFTVVVVSAVIPRLAFALYGSSEMECLARLTRESHAELAGLKVKTIKKYNILKDYYELTGANSKNESVDIRVRAVVIQENNSEENSTKYYCRYNWDHPNTVIVKEIIVGSKRVAFEAGSNYSNK